MLKSLTTAATGMTAQQTNMDVIANNLANVSTTGFKKSQAEFEDLVYQTIKEPGQSTGLIANSPNGVQVGLGVRAAGIKKDMQGGSAVVTKNPFDMQIEGNGFFQVLLPTGETGYTRDGSFKKDANGNVVDKNGNALQPQLNIPANVTGIEISPGGEVSVTVDGTSAPQIVGQIEVANFINPAGLKAMGRNVFTQTPSSGQPITSQPGQNGTGQIAQGQIEASNVNIVEEMVNMINAQRAFETNSKMIQASDQMLQGINNMR